MKTRVICSEALVIVRNHSMVEEREIETSTAATNGVSNHSHFTMSGCIIYVLSSEGARTTL